MAKQRTNSKSSNGADLGFEQKLWAAADKLRGHLDASEYKHVVLGLIFLKYISDAFEERHAELQSSSSERPLQNHYNCLHLGNLQSQPNSLDCSQLIATKGKIGGGRGIRTPGTVSGTVVFKTTRFNHSRIPP